MIPLPALPMTDACTPPPGTAPGSWHWLEWEQVGGITPPDKPLRYPMRWRIEQYADAPPEGLWELDEDTDASPETAARKGWRYHSAVPEPEEVEALRRVVRDGWKNTRQPTGHSMVRHGLAEVSGGSALHVKLRLTPLGRRALGVEGP